PGRVIARHAGARARCRHRHATYSHTVRGSQLLEGRLAELGERVDGWTRELLEAEVSAEATRFGAMLGYHLGWRNETLQLHARPGGGGKKLRCGIALLA